MAAELAGVRKDLAEELAAVRKDLAEELAAVRKDLAAELAEVRKDLAAEMAEVRKDLAAIREMLAFICGQSASPSRVLQLPRHERGESESERDEA